MIACGTLTSGSECLLERILCSGRGNSVFRRDAVWESLQTEAIVEADSEPLLRSRIEQLVLARESFADGLAMMLSRQLADAGFDSSGLYHQFREVLAEDPAVVQSARDDLHAITANDPAVSSLLHPYLNFKGFHALQAHRIAHALWMNERPGLAYHIQNRVSEVFSVDQCWK